MTPKTSQRSLEQALAFKAYEIEELADVYFFRPLGALIAYASRPVGISPTGLTVFGGIVGVVGGALLYRETLGLLAFALLIAHGVVDSADGQLARLTNRTSELGRILDGVGGYATHIAAYLAIAAGAVARGSSYSVYTWAVAAGISTMLQAQMYDYHRTVYATVVLNARPPVPRAPHVGGWADRVSALYFAIQRKMIGAHAEVEDALRRRAIRGQVPDGDRERYRRLFYWPVRGWNVLGDNTRFYAIGVLAFVHRLPWFFAFIVVVMNLVFALLWAWQQRADRRFLETL